jgi:type I restriction enzyme S subunit
MSDWPIVSLGSLAEFRNGLNYSAAERGSGLAIVGVRDFQNYSFVRFAELEELDPAALQTNESLIRKDDILFVRSNGNRELIGRSLFVSEQPRKPTSHSGFTIRLRFIDRRVLPAFYAYFLRGGVVRKLLSSQGGGTSINNLNQGILDRLEVPVPPLDEQRRIASILGAYDDLIEVNRRRVAVLEAMARGLFEEWFVRFRFPGHENHKIIDTPDGPLPEGWAWQEFGSFAADVRDPVSPSDVSPDSRYVGLEHIPRRSTTLDAYGRADEVGSLKLKFQRGDVLFGKIRPYFHKVAWAPCAGVASSDAIVFRAKREEYGALALLVASSDDFVAKAVQTSNGTKMPRANPSVLRAHKVASGGLAFARRFNATAMPLIELAASLQSANEELAASRDLLLPRLISDELSVAAAEAELEAAA